MATVELPDPLTQRPLTPQIDVVSLQQVLTARVDGEVRFDAGSRGAYSTDASNFRQVPVGVVLPRTVEAGAEAVAVCREHDAPLLSRGGGASLAGQCTNTAVVIDWSKYCHNLLSVDVEARTCVVEPGIVLDELNRQLAPHGLRYGPEPAQLHHRRHDRQQLLRSDRPADRQGRRQHRPAGGPALRRHALLVQRNQRRGIHRDRATW
jgi:hypothetical protein